VSNIFSKLRDFVGLNDPVDYEYEYAEVDGEEYRNLYQEEHPQPATTIPEEEPRRRRLRERMTLSNETSGVGTVSNVIGMPGAVNGMSEVVVMEPRSFEEMPQAIRALRERKSVVLNLTIMDPDQAQRAVDFIAGGTPNCVQVSTQLTPDMVAPQPQMRPRATPTPAWTTDQARMA
jgi:cell division inhibitor SepF